MKHLNFKKNNPFNTSPLKELWVYPEEMPLIHPKASYPIKDEEWISIFADDKGVSVLVYQEGLLVGHFGLIKEVERKFRVVFVYLIHSCRGKGISTKMMKMIEDYASKQYQATELSLNVQDFNERAFSLYKKCGYLEDHRYGTTIHMKKQI